MTIFTPLLYNTYSVVGGGGGICIGVWGGRAWER